MTVHGYQVVTVSEPTGNAEQVFELQCTAIIYANGHYGGKASMKLVLKAIADAKKQSENSKKDGKNR